MFRTIAEYILTFGRVPSRPRIISRSDYGSVLFVNEMKENLFSTTTCINLHFHLGNFLEEAFWSPPLHKTEYRIGLLWLSATLPTGRIVRFSQQFPSRGYS